MPFLTLVLFILVSIAVLTDLRTHKIYNWLTFSGILLGFILNHNLLFSLKGVGLGLLLFIIPFALGGFGGGDVKLITMIGSFVGAHQIFWVSLYTAVSGGILALIYIVLKHKSLAKIKNYLYGFALKVRHPELLKNPDKQRFPYSTAILLGLILSYFLN
jgi:prepilin peptidase CpaA